MGAAEAVPKAAAASRWLAASEAIEANRADEERRFLRQAIEAAEEPLRTSSSASAGPSVSDSQTAATDALNSPTTPIPRADAGDFFGSHPLRVMAKQCVEAKSSQRPLSWDAFFDDYGDDGRGLGLAERPAG